MLLCKHLRQERMLSPCAIPFYPATGTCCIITEIEDKRHRKIKFRKGTNSIKIISKSGKSNVERIKRY